MSENGKFIARYPGTVFDNDDPKKLGRVKLIVSEVGFSDVSKTTDWAYPVMNVLGSGFGMFTVPPKGTKVWVEFRHGNPNIPIYDGGWFASDGGKSEAPKASREADPDLNDSKIGDDAAPEYPKNNVFATPSGHVLEFDDTPGAERIRIFHKSGSQKQWREDGDVRERIKKSWTVEIDETVLLRAVLGMVLDGGDFGGPSKLGVHTEATHPVCIIAGLPLGSSLSCKASS